MGALCSKGPKQYANETEELRAWLKGHHVSSAKIDACLERSGIVNLKQLALYLRLQLPPLDYANEASLREHMRNEFGVWNWRADKMIKGLDIASALPLLCVRIVSVFSEAGSERSSCKAAKPSQAVGTLHAADCTCRQCASARAPMPHVVRPSCACRCAQVGRWPSEARGLDARPGAASSVRRGLLSGAAHIAIGEPRSGERSAVRI